MKFNFGVFVAFVLILKTVKSNETNNNVESIDSQSIPRIEADENLNATLGKTISMKCTVYNLKNYKIAWYFNGILLALNNIRIKDDKRYTVDNPKLNEWRLNIDPVDITHDGQYSCHVNNGLKKIINLKVGMAPVFIGNNDSHIIINALEKQNVTLTCEAEGNPPPLIYWYKNNKLVATGTQYVKKDISRHSNAVYECVARNGIEPDPSRLFKINVNFKPTIHLMYHLTDYQNQSLKLYSNELNELELVCEITGNPINSINWFKDGIKIKDENNHHRYRMNRNSNYNFVQSYTMTTQSTNDFKHKYKKHISIHMSHNEKHYKYISKLRIINYDESDNGVYKCSVNGFEGDSSKSVSIQELSVKSLEAEQSLSAKNTIVNKNEKFTKKVGKQDDYVRIQDNNYMHERARGARYNLTKSAGIVQEKIDIENSVTILKYNVYVYALIVFKSIMFSRMY